MSQAKRIKKTPLNQPKKVKLKKTSLPLGLISVIIVSSIILGVLLAGASSSNDKMNGWGTGLKQLFHDHADTVTQDNEISELIEKQSVEKEFDFYEVLPDIETVMVDDVAESTTSRPVDNRDYYLQVASFRAHADAEKLRARLSLKGYKSITQARQVKDKGTFYRVRLGPYADKRKAKTVKNKLKKLGVRPFVYGVKK